MGSRRSCRSPSASRRASMRLRCAWRGLRVLGVMWLAGWALLANATFFGSPEGSRHDPLEEAQPLDPGASSARRSRRSRAGRSEQAIDALRRGSRAEPGPGDARRDAGRALACGGRGEEALAVGARRAARGPRRDDAAPAGRRALAGAGRAAARRVSLRCRRAASSDDAHRPHRCGAQEAGWRRCARRASGRRRSASCNGCARAASSPLGERLLAELLLDAPGALRDPPLALAIAEEIEREVGDADVAALDVLAAAQAATGKTAEAVRTQERALAGWRASGDTAAAERAELRLREYRRAAGV